MWIKVPGETIGSPITNVPSVRVCYNWWGREGDLSPKGWLQRPALSLWAIKLMMAGSDEMYRSGQSINGSLKFIFIQSDREPQRLRRPRTCTPRAFGGRARSRLSQKERKHWLTAQREDCLEKAGGKGESWEKQRDKSTEWRNMEEEVNSREQERCGRRQDCFKLILISYIFTHSSFWSCY